MYIVEKQPKLIAAESYRTLRTNIQYSSFDEKCKVIIITSSIPGEGKSTTGGNLTLSMADGEKNILLVNCDLRKPAIHKNFGISNAKGLSDVMVEPESVKDVCQKYNKNLTILTAEKIPLNSAEMVNSKSMANLIEALKQVFDYVILDTSPVQAVADAQILSTKVDGSILVVIAESTKKDAVHNTVDLLKSIKSNIIGTVLNGLETKKVLLLLL